MTTTVLLTAAQVVLADGKFDSNSKFLRISNAGAGTQFPLPYGKTVVGPAGANVYPTVTYSVNGYVQKMTYQASPTFNAAMNMVRTE